MTIGSQMPELDRMAFLPPPPPYKIGSQSTPYKLGLNCVMILHVHNHRTDLLELESVNFILENERRLCIFGRFSKQRDHCSNTSDSRISLKIITSSPKEGNHCKLYQYGKYKS